MSGSEAAEFVLGTTMWIFGMLTGLIFGVCAEFKFNLIDRLKGPLLRPKDKKK